MTDGSRDPSLSQQPRNEFWSSRTGGIFNSLDTGRKNESNLRERRFQDSHSRSNSSNSRQRRFQNYRSRRNSSVEDLDDAGHSEHPAKENPNLFENTTYFGIIPRILKKNGHVKSAEKKLEIINNRIYVLKRHIVEVQETKP